LLGILGKVLILLVVTCSDIWAGWWGAFGSGLPVFVRSPMSVVVSIYDENNAHNYRVPDLLRFASALFVFGSIGIGDELLDDRLRCICQF